MGRKRWRRTTEEKLRALRENLPPHPSRFRAAETAGLPEPARRYFSYAIPEGHPLPAWVTLDQAGQILLGRWRRFTAQSHVRVKPPGFLWSARVRMLPLVTAWVEDAYVDGRGSMSASLAGVIPLVTAPPGTEISAASLQRYLAEGAWAPASLLPSAGVTWEAEEDDWVRATLADWTNRVSVHFHVQPTGEIDEIRTDRYRSVNGRQVLTRWIGRFCDYRRAGGMMIPHRGEVGWALDGKWEPYWRGEILRVTAGGS